MKSITATEFEKRTDRDPSWCKDLTEDLEIRTFCNMCGSNITHLSPHLFFTGKDKIYLWVANFAKCRNLKIAEGNFAGYVNFLDSGIEEIGDLKVTDSDQAVESANFSFCKNLKVASGEYYGAVIFRGAAVKSINNLSIKYTNDKRFKADFSSCKNLTHLSIPSTGIDPEYNFDPDFIELVEVSKTMTRIPRT